MTTPAMNPTANSGAASQKVVINACRAIWTTVSGVMSVKTLHERADTQVPACHQHGQPNLEGRRDHHWWQLHHADREGHAGDHEIDHEEWKEQNGPDLKAGLQLRQDVSRDQNFQFEIVGRTRRL